MLYKRLAGHTRDLTPRPTTLTHSVVADNATTHLFLPLSVSSLPSYT